ncbi:MAG: ribosome maturation factor RimP [Acidobacteriota bacterium]
MIDKFLEEIRKKARELARKVVEAEGLELFHLELKQEGHRGILKVFIDKEEGVNINDCERVSHQLSTELDVENFIPFSYTLEVSSPGLDRPLFSEKDYARYAGKAARIRTHDAIDGQRNFKGRLKGFSDGIVTLEVDVRKGETRDVQIPLSSIASARLEIEI